MGRVVQRKRDKIHWYEGLKVNNGGEVEVEEEEGEGLNNSKDLLKENMKT